MTLPSGVGAQAVSNRASSPSLSHFDADPFTVQESDDFRNDFKVATCTSYLVKVKSSRRSDSCKENPFTQYELLKAMIPRGCLEPHSCCFALAIAETIYYRTTLRL
jgi:hypothetical protein